MRLQRVSYRLYHEINDGAEEPLKWWKHFEYLSIRLTDVCASEGVSLDIRGVNSWDKSRIAETRRIDGRGKFERRREIKLIEPNGRETAPFDEVEVAIMPTDKWDEAAEGPTLEEIDEIPDWHADVLRPKASTKFATQTGYLGHFAGESLRYATERRREYLGLELYIPTPYFLVVWNRLIADRNAVAVRLRTRVAVFQSELERMAAAPYHFQTYYIERESANWAFPVSLDVFTAPAVPSPTDESDDEAK